MTENEAITWPFGQATHPPNSIPNNTKGKAKNKSGKSGTIFGVLVNEIQAKADRNVNKQGKSVPSSSTHPSNVDTTDAANNEHSFSDGEREAPKGHRGFPVRVVKS